MTESTLLSALALQNVTKIGDISAKKLIQFCGSVEAVFKEKKNTLLKIDGIGALMISDLFAKRHFLEAEQELKFIQDNKIDCLFF